MSVIEDKAGQSYWDKVWQDQPLPSPIRPKRWSLRGHVYWTYHQMFVRALQDRDTRGQTLLEIGCGRSRWLPYFAQQFGFKIAGIDYSAIGCEQSQAILRAAGLDGDIVEADFFTPPPRLLECSDVLVSFGVVEHFADTAATLAAFARFLRPGGLMITVIPNLAGWIGTVQKRLDRAIYDIHVPLNRQDLQQAHSQAGLEVRSCQHLLGVSLTVLTHNYCSQNFLSPIVRILPHALSAPFWLLDWVKLGVPRNRWTSPYIVCLAEKPRGQEDASDERNEQRQAPHPKDSVSIVGAVRQ